MLCKSPFMVGILAYSCGRCLPCRINAKIIWVNRMVLESLTHDQNTFVTLTYENTPDGSTLAPNDTKKFLKRLRNNLPGTRFRYFLVGEYGTETGRPHYHLNIFGLSQLDAPLIEKTWGMGHILCGDFNSATAAYTCGYILKRMTSKNDDRLKGRYPEFTRKSNRPGLGAPAMKIVADALHSPAGLNEMEALQDVPHKIKIGGKDIYLGRYLINYLRKEVGLPQKWLSAIKQKNAVQQGLEMSEMFYTEAKSNPVPTFTSAHLSHKQGSIWAVEGRAKIQRSKTL